METKQAAKDEVALYVERAHEMLAVAAHNLADGFYGSAVNRAYYAIFYAANALLATQGVARSKHSGIIAAFRERFVKTGLIEAEYSRIYGRVMDDRETGDYDVGAPIEPERAQDDLEDALRFVERVEHRLREGGWL